MNTLLGGLELKNNFTGIIRKDDSELKRILEQQERIVLRSNKYLCKIKKLKYIYSVIYNSQDLCIIYANYS